MNREHLHDEPIELGAASALTRGSGGVFEDTEANLRPIAGLAID